MSAATAKQCTNHVGLRNQPCWNCGKPLSAEHPPVAASDTLVQKINERAVREAGQREIARKLIAKSEVLSAFTLCGCGCAYSKAQWLKLPLCGHQQGDELLEMRNCVNCKSTLAVAVTPYQQLRSLAAKVAQTKGASDLERLMAAGVLAHLVLRTVPE